MTDNVHPIRPATPARPVRPVTTTTGRDAQPATGAGDLIHGRTWQLTFDERPTPQNAYRRLHHHQRAAYDRRWRNTFAWLARQAHLPALDMVSITVAQACHRPPLPDVGACFATAKAAIDGLVDAGVIPDDNPAHVKFLGFAAPERGPIDLFALIVEELTHQPLEGDPTP